MNDSLIASEVGSSQQSSQITTPSRTLRSFSSGTPSVPLLILTEEQLNSFLNLTGPAFERLNHPQTFIPLLSSGDPTIRKQNISTTLHSLLPKLTAAVRESQERSSVIQAVVEGLAKSFSYTESVQFANAVLDKGKELFLQSEEFELAVDRIIQKSVLGKRVL